ncbi:MAG: CDP-alcohol phosphatidyltransferase family protein [Planctomycetota bacterium]|jgi:CDP-diacylglycerol--serine O-phosphatidyltransferase
MKRIHPLPTLLTLGNFGSGFVAIVLAARALMDKSALEIKPFGAVDPVYLLCLACGCIFLGMAFDMLDGKVARMTGSACQFGGEMDSLADVCSFGLAPAAILTMNWLRVEPETARWWSMALGFGFVYASLAAIRLARYNVESDTTAKDYFHGLPSPAAAGAVVSTFWFLHSGGVHDIVLGWVATDAIAAEQTLTRILSVYMLVMGFLMVTRVRYAHFSNKMLGGRKRLTHVVAALFLVFLFFCYPAAILCLGFNIYVGYGLIKEALRRLPGHRGGEASASSASSSEIIQMDEHPAAREDAQ